MNIWYWIIGGIAGWILGDIVKSNSSKEDTMWAIIVWFLVTITCYAVVALNF